jgi:hypothetical protein
MMHESVEMKPSTATTNKQRKIARLQKVNIAFALCMRSEINALDSSVTSGFAHLMRNSFGTPKVITISKTG